MISGIFCKKNVPSAHSCAEARLPWQPPTTAPSVHLCKLCLLLWNREFYRNFLFHNKEDRRFFCGPLKYSVSSVRLKPFLHFPEHPGSCELQHPLRSDELRSDTVSDRSSPDARTLPDGYLLSGPDEGQSRC